MTTLERPHDATHADLLGRLERTVQELWCMEPVASNSDRVELMTRLSSLSSTLDQVRVRAEIHPDDAIDADVLDTCVDELAFLTDAWLIDPELTS